MAAYWSPKCARPPDLVRPVRRDLTGRTGPTKGQVASRGWRSPVRGWHVPADAPDCVEQRILEQSVRIPDACALTAWSALRWYGGAYFDGVDRATGEVLPVSVVLGGWIDIGRDSAIHVSRERFWPHHVRWVDDVPCAIPERALFDEVRRHGFRRAVVAADMTFAAGITTASRFASYVGQCNGWTGVPGVRELLPWISDDSRSPQESLMRLIWEVDAGLPRPLCNRPVFDLDGDLLGIPDLFDPVAGVVGEYDGGHHASHDQRHADLAREERFRSHGLEYFTLVRGDLSDRTRAARRMLGARRRALFAPVAQRRWTLDVPPWWRTRHTAA